MSLPGRLALGFVTLVLVGCGANPPKFDVQAFVAKHQAEIDSYSSVAGDPEKHLGEEVTWIGRPESQSRNASTMTEEAVLSVPSDNPAQSPVFFFVRGPKLNLPTVSSLPYYRVRGKVAGTAEWGAAKAPVLEQATFLPLE